MPDPIGILGMDLIVKGYSPDVVNDLCGVMRRPVKWIAIPNAPEGSRAWEGRSGDWIFALADFSIEDQPGHAPGARGQSLGISNGRLGLALMSDGALFHAIANYLVENMNTEDVFVGRATMTMDDESGSEERLNMGNLDLRFPADLRRAVQWQSALMDKLNEGGLWQMTGADYQCFKSEKRVVVCRGDMPVQVRIAFLAMGWMIQESTPHEEDTRIAVRWAKRYTG